VIDKRDSGVVELVVARVTSSSALRAAERDARLRDSDEVRRAFGKDESAEDDRRNASSSKASSRNGGVKERFVVAMYASVEPNDRSKKNWILLGRHACEPSVHEPHAGVLVPLFRDEEKRDVVVARSLIAAPKFQVPAKSRAASTTFHVLLSAIIDDSTTRGGVIDDADNARRAWDANALSNDAKTRLVGEAKFTLMDLCASDAREVRLDVRNRSVKQPSLGAVDVKHAEITIRMTPPEISRAWCAEKVTDSAFVRLRDVAPRGAMSFEALFEQYEDVVIDANAVVGVDHYNARKAKLKAQTARMRLNAPSSSSPSSSKAKASFRLAAPDDADRLDDDASATSRPPNRASGARARAS
jgi:hypothetical protein